MNDTIKEANRLHFMVKGTLLSEDVSIEQCNDIIRSYTKRLWGNHEAGIYEEGFEELWTERDRNH